MVSHEPAANGRRGEPRTRKVRDAEGAIRKTVDLYRTTAWEAIIDHETFLGSQRHFAREVVARDDGS